MPEIVWLFLVVYALNLIPAFAPPTWMVFSFLGFRNHARHVEGFALMGALAATLGRLTLAKLSRVIIRQKLLNEASRRNIDAIREGLQGRKRLTFSVFLFYAFSPFPSNYLFIAYGLTTMEWRLIAVPFFLGRLVSYSFWGMTSSAVGRWLAVEWTGTVSYLTLSFVVTQIFLLYVVYLFTRIDWRGLFEEGKLRWLPKKTGPPGSP